VLLLAVYFGLVDCLGVGSSFLSSSMATRSTENDFDFKRFFNSARSFAFDMFFAGRMLMIATRVKRLQY